MPLSPVSATPPGRHRATWWDRLSIVLLGVAGCALSFDALRQMATAVHVRHPLTYLFPVVIDGFIAYGVRALLVLREAPLPARLYAWTLFIAATCASIWANGLHALDLNQPGSAALRLDDTTVAVLSATAPLALAGATHLHILITRYGTSPASTTERQSGTPTQVPDGTQPVPPNPVEVPDVDPAPLTSADIPREESLAVSPLDGGVETSDADCAAQAISGGADNPDGAEEESGQASDSAGQEPEESAVLQPVPKGGRPPLASITQLADVISAAHPDGSGLTRDSAREAVEKAGLGAATGRLTEAIALVRQRTQALPHPTG
ncbi:DUF2637 domain-containing protein [Streptantibioticus ferralitis]|uniref:DUF2637 domain-containing protein n=1 Tax=Streptantibioticus ferralitis TaxID=236510 RepID=A0ABT5Z0L3_9ACTN|nr:DUF2637 domain-containing protein [Streptantibioticus ferralitis]MDF2257330.1 DUF2637 domain-containing protein [Streptantibioticus ferralitis]